MYASFFYFNLLFLFSFFRLKPRRSQITVEPSPGEGWTKQKPQKAFGQPGQYELADFLKVKVCIQHIFFLNIYIFIFMLNPVVLYYMS